jgi:predicted transcriptional regulator
MKKDVTADFLLKNASRLDELSSLMRAVQAALVRIEARLPPQASPPQEPAVPITASVRPGLIACLECGKSFRALRFHLRMHGLSPVAYRAKWGLPIDYPITAPELAEKRSALAVANDFGHSRKRRSKDGESAH